MRFTFTTAVTWENAVMDAFWSLEFIRRKIMSVRAPIFVYFEHKFGTIDVNLDTHIDFAFSPRLSHNKHAIHQTKDTLVRS